MRDCLGQPRRTEFSPACGVNPPGGAVSLPHHRMRSKRAGTERAEGFSPSARSLSHSSLGQDVFDRMAMHVRESAFDAVVIKREPFVIEAEQVKDGGV